MLQRCVHGLYRDFVIQILKSKIWWEKVWGHVTKLMTPGGSSSCISLFDEEINLSM